MKIAENIYNTDNGCSDCAPLAVLFERSAPKRSADVYFDIIRELTEMEKRGVIELYAGDCPLGKAAEAVESELLYTVYHYVRCKKNAARYTSRAYAYAARGSSRKKSVTRKRTVWKGCLRGGTGYILRR